MMDRISSLPDSLLLHILTFLPTKLAVATSFSSKRWRPLRHSLPTIVIHDADFCGLDAFIHFVDDLLIGDLKFLKNFGLDCCTFNVPPIKINTWVNALINSKVENLHIWFSYRLNVSLPSAIFNCSTIRVLKLKGITVRDLSTVNLPSLKVLHFNRARFPDVNCVSILLSGCPLLESLALRRSDINNHVMIPNIRKLNHLITADIPPLSMPLEAFSNVTFLNLNEIWSPRDDIPTFYNVTHLGCVVDGWSKMVNRLQKFPKLENLIIYELGVRSAPERVLNVPTCISLHLKEFTLGDFLNSEKHFEFVRFIMENARVLRTVTVWSRSSILYAKKEIVELLSSYPKLLRIAAFI